ncbi:MAG: hypothetical protein WC908_03380 [Candidatus Paceibacterota bacterium]
MKSQGSDEPLSLPDILKQGEAFRDAYSQITRRWESAKFLNDVFNKAKITIFLKAEIFNGLQNVNKIVFGWANEEKTISVPSSAVQSNIIYLIVLTALKVKYDRLRNCSTTGLLCNKDIEVLEKVLIKKTHRINLLKYPLKNIYTPWNEFGKNRKLTRAPSLSSLKESYFRPTKCPKDAFLCYVKTTTPNQTLCLFNVHPENISLYSPYGDTQMNIPAIQSAINPFFDELCLKVYATSDKSSIKTAQSAEEEYKKGLLRKYRTDIPTTSLEKHKEAFIQVVKKSIATSLKTESIKKSSELASWEITNVLKRRDKGKLDLLKPGGPSLEDFIGPNAYVYELPVVEGIIKIMDQVHRIIIEGISSSGKSTILKNIGIKVCKKRNVYYVSFKNSLFPENKMLESLSNDDLLLIDDVHLNKFEVEKILQNTNIKCVILLASRNLPSTIFSNKYPRLAELANKKIVLRPVPETIEGIIKKINPNLDMSTTINKLYEMCGDFYDFLQTDLWVLTFALAAKKNTEISFEHLTKKYFFERLTSDYRIDTPGRILIPLAVFSYYEISIRKEFLTDFLKISSHEIDVLANAHEIILDNGMLSLPHRAIARAILVSLKSDIFKDALRDLFHCCDSKYNDNVFSVIFSVYLSDYPDNFWDIFYKICEQDHSILIDETRVKTCDYFLRYKKNDILRNLHATTSLDQIKSVFSVLDSVVSGGNMYHASARKNAKSFLCLFERIFYLIKRNRLDSTGASVLSTLLRMTRGTRKYTKIVRLFVTKINTGNVIPKSFAIQFAIFGENIGSNKSSMSVNREFLKLNNKSLATALSKDDIVDLTSTLPMALNQLRRLNPRKAKKVLRVIPRVRLKEIITYTIEPDVMQFFVLFDSIYAIDKQLLLTMFSEFNHKLRRKALAFFNHSISFYRRYILKCKRRPCIKCSDDCKNTLARSETIRDIMTMQGTHVKKHRK